MSTSTTTATTTLRNVASSLRILQQLQNYGLPFMKYIQHKDQITQTMHYYLTRLGIDITAIPPVIHIAGTKGKGSTAAFTESILRHQGLTTGLYTSPHLIHVTERFRINGQPIQESLYLKAFYSSWDTLNDGITFGKHIFDEHSNGSSTVNENTSNTSNSTAIIRKKESTDTMINGADTSSSLSSPSSSSSSSSVVSSSSSASSHPFATLPPLPGFNFLTLLAFKLFLEAQVDVIILEVGLGGRLDATNIVPKDKVAVCGISTLDYDHVELLGYTLKDIAKEKAGIFKPGVPAVTVYQPKEGLQALCEIAQKEGTPLFMVDPVILRKRIVSESNTNQQSSSHKSSELSSLLKLGLAGEFQYINAALALALVDIFQYQRQADRVLVTRDKGLSSLSTRTLSMVSNSSSLSSSAAAATHAPLGSPPADTISIIKDEEPSRPRSSSFHDHFGSSTVPSVGQYTYPPPLYDNVSPLPIETLTGLAKTQWPGRAQIFDITYEASPILSSIGNPSMIQQNNRVTKKGGQFSILTNNSNVPSSTYLSKHKLRLYIDGAHTEKSMQEICKWFVSINQRQQQQQEEEEVSIIDNKKERILKRYVLLFNCGSDKDVLALLLPLTILPFTSIHLTPVPWTLTTRAQIPTVETALALYIDRRKKMNDQIAIQEMEMIAKEYNISLPTMDNVNNSTNNITSTEPLAWQKGLRQLWIEIHHRPEFQPIRNRLRNVIIDPTVNDSLFTSVITNKSNEHGTVISSSSPLVHGHYLEALETIYEEHDQTIQMIHKEENSHQTVPTTVETHVLVTGSLYLVGNVLEGIGYYPS